MLQSRTLGPHNAAQTATCQWVHVDAATVDDVQPLVAKYHLPAPWVAAALNPHADPRLEGLDGKDGVQGLILLRVPYTTQNPNNHQVFETAPLAVIMRDDLVVTISGQPLSILPDIERLGAAHDNVPAFAAGIVQTVCHEFTDAAEDVDADTRAMESRVTNSSHNDLLLEIMALSKSLVFLGATLNHSHTVVHKLLNTTSIFAHDGIGAVLLHRANIELGQALTLNDSTEKILDQYNATISAIVANNLNLIMKVLTSVSIILAIPPIISGIWGQNTWLPWSNHDYGFWVVVGLALALSLIVAWWLRRKEYF